MRISEWWWKFSIFGRNSRILKVLAHEISDEIPKKIKIFNFNGMMNRGNHYFFLSVNIMKKNYVLVEVFNFWSKFSIFKGVSPRNEWRNPNKINFFYFNGL